MPLAKGDDDVEEVGRGLGRMFPARPTRCGCMVDQPFSRYSMQCTAALWLTPSITPAGLAPTRARDGQTIFILGTLKAFQNFHAMAVLKPIILRKKEGFSVQTESVLVQRWKSGRRCRHVCAIFLRCC